MEKITCYVHQYSMPEFGIKYRKFKVAFHEVDSANTKILSLELAERIDGFSWFIYSDVQMTIAPGNSKFASYVLSKLTGKNKVWDFLSALEDCEKYRIKIKSWIMQS